MEELKACFLQLRDLVARIPASDDIDVYRLEDWGKLEKLSFSEFRLRGIDGGARGVIVSYRLRGDTPARFVTRNAKDRDYCQRMLSREGLQFSVDGRTGLQFGFTVMPSVPITASLEPFREDQSVRITLRNLEELGSERVYMSEPERLTYEAVEELGKAMVRAPNRFEDCIRSEVSGAIRAQLRAALEAKEREQPSRPEAQRKASATALLGRLFGQRGRGASERTTKGEKPRAPTPAKAAAAPSPSDPMPPRSRSSRSRPAPPPPAAAARKREPAPARPAAPPAPEPPYTWLITGDPVDGNTSDHLGRVGPSRPRHQSGFARIISEGEHFRMRGEAGKVLYTGYIAGDYRGEEPLRDFGTANGCVQIEYYRDGRWAPLVAS